ncbi:hypothetical protein BSPLISOX_2538, partial [uncultured Gammaproteobacteria bacterium]
LNNQQLKHTVDNTSTVKIIPAHHNLNNQQLKLSIISVFARLSVPAHHNLNNQQLKQTETITVII